MSRPCHRLFPAPTVLLCCLSAASARAQEARNVPLAGQLAQQYFTEADSLARKDGGRLWGRSLAAPLLLVDRDSRKIVANLPDRDGHLVADGRLYTGILPQSQNVANTAFDWSGRRWTMLVTPLPLDAAQRASLMLHEMWHRIQDSLGFPAASPTNDHLDQLEGRTWLRLEGHALRTALESSGTRRREATTDALAFRRFRHAHIPGSDSSERQLELNEGLAEYTGLTLAGFTGRVGAREVAARLGGLDTATHLGRSFAYLTGPAYGLLLDWTGRPWRPTLTPNDELSARLGALLTIPITEASLTEVRQRAMAYGYREVRGAEEAREQTRAARQAGLRQRFIEGPVLRLPLMEMRLGFDPGKVVPLDSAGTVYGTLRIVDRWGVLDVTAGGGLVRDWAEAIVPAPTDANGTRIGGEGWTLDLAEGWTVVPGARTGDFQILGPP
jgi:hypothetical protein